MKRLTSMVFLLVLLSYTLSGCSQAGAPTGVVPATASGVEDQASFLAALQGTGASAEVVDTVEQIFFTPVGSIIAVNGADVQVFEYPSAEAMEAEATSVAPDGGSIGMSMVTWIDTPHFYKSGRIIVIYVGADTAVIGLLEMVMGPQFAGR